MSINSCKPRWVFSNVVVWLENEGLDYLFRFIIFWDAGDKVCKFYYGGISGYGLVHYFNANYY